MGVRDVIRALVSPHRAPTTELEQRIADVEEHAEVTDQRLDQAEARMTRLEAKRELRRRRNQGPEPHQ